MKQLNPVESWLDNVAYAHSNSPNTEESYRTGLRDFATFIEATPQQILNDYEKLEDREFRRKYAQYLKAFISWLGNEGLTANTISSKVNAVKSFFKYSDLPLAYVPVAQNKIVFHNRDITQDEIAEILKVSSPRDRAFYAVMTQSGLRPATLCNLRRKHLEPDFSKGVIPCEIEVPEELAKGKFGAYFTFIGIEAVEYLRSYFKKRPEIGAEDYVFVSRGGDKKLNRKSVAAIFARTIDTLKEKGVMDFEQKEAGKPRTVRLYNLRKYFRNHAGQAGVEYTNFWMGHKANYKAPHIPASDVHYFSREDVEFQRDLYKEKAMPFLRLETATPTETERTIQELREKIENLKTAFQLFANTVGTLHYDPEKEMFVSVPFETPQPDWVPMMKKEEMGKRGHPAILVKPADVDKWRKKGWEIIETKP